MNASDEGSISPTPRPVIALDVMGPPQLLTNGLAPPPELLWRKHLALLVYLARSTSMHTRDHLMGLLWPEKEEAKARHSLNEALRVIRRTLGEALQTEGENVRLLPEAIRIDADNLKNSEKFGLFLDGFTVPDAPAFEHWMVVERELLRVKTLDHLVAESERLLSAGQLNAARDIATKALELEPLHEPAVQKLMVALALGGGRSLALNAFRRFKEDVERDLDMEPSAATARLMECIRSEHLVPGDSAAGETVDDLVPVVGRARSVLSSCVEAWNRTRTGVPTMILIRGDSGTGKTRIADEVAARARLDGGAVAFARAAVGENVDRIWSAFLRGGLAVPELAGAAPQILAALGELEPDLLVRFPAAKQCNPTPEDGEPFGQAVTAVAEMRPVLLVLDDANRADGSVLQAIGSILQRAGAVPVCAVLTVSKSPTSAVDLLCQSLGRDIKGLILEMEFFGHVDVEELVAWAFPEYEADMAGRLSRRVLADTAGNPFLAVELVRAVRAGLKLRDEASPAAWPEKARTLEQTMPGDLPQAVAASFRIRYQALSGPGQIMLVVVAVLGGGESLETMAQAGGLTVSDAEKALDELEWQRWLVADARGYTFVTRLALDVVRADMVTRGRERRILERAKLNR